MPRSHRLVMARRLDKCELFTVVPGTWQRLDASVIILLLLYQSQLCFDWVALYIFIKFVFLLNASDVNLSSKFFYSHIGCLGR